MQGKRVETDKPWELAQGEYAKGGTQADGATHWWICPPGSVFGTISDKVHTITEHEDGTITVSPSILLKYGPGGSESWHGYLERGVWRTC